MRYFFTLTSFTLIFNFSHGQLPSPPEDNPIELGKVNWLRNYDEALALSRKTLKPIAILFQEVPGCSNCTQYGQNILSHPLIVEALEDEFVPLAIFNNKKGHDKEILDHFNEPSWNNPVVRFVNENGVPLGKRISNFHSTSLLLHSMKNVLKKSKKNVPNYLDLLCEEHEALENETDEFYLSMYCFWTGEKEIGKIKGVVSTEAGYMHGKEVVKVKYDEKQTNQSQISQLSSAMHCADQIFSDTKVRSKLPQKAIGKYRKDSQDKYFLLNSEYKKVPMTEFQKMKTNSALGNGRDPKKYLSPRQILILNNKTYKKSFISDDIITGWYSSKKV